MYHVCIGVAAAANIALVNKLLSLVINPEADPTIQLSVGLCPEAVVINPEDDPFGLETHWMGAWSDIPYEKMASFLNLSNALPTPSNGWPWTVNAVEHLTEAEAAIAAGSVTFYTLSQAEPDNQAQHTLLASVKLATGLKTLDV